MCEYGIWKMETCECHFRKRELKKVTNVKMNQTWGIYGNVTTKFTIPLLCTHAIVEKQRKRKKTKTLSD
jgi:hypothetical protein